MLPAGEGTYVHGVDTDVVRGDVNSVDSGADTDVDINVDSADVNNVDIAGVEGDVPQHPGQYVLCTRFWCVSIWSVWCALCFERLLGLVCSVEGRLVPPVWLPHPDFRPLFCVPVQHAVCFRSCLPSPGLSQSNGSLCSLDLCAGDRSPFPATLSLPCWLVRWGAGFGPQCRRFDGAGCLRLWCQDIRVVGRCRRFR